MESKEVRNWQDQEALKRLEMITPLMDPDMDDAKRCQMREEIAEKNNITTRSLYRYEKYYRENSFDGLRPMNRQMRRSAKLPKNYQEKVTIDSITEEDYTVKLEVNLSQNKAKELCRKLKHTFNQCSVTPVE